MTLELKVTIFGFMADPRWSRRMNMKSRGSDKIFIFQLHFAVRWTSTRRYKLLVRRRRWKRIFRQIYESMVGLNLAVQPRNLWLFWIQPGEWKGIGNYGSCVLKWRVYERNPNRGDAVEKNLTGMLQTVTGQLCTEETLLGCLFTPCCRLTLDKY